MASEKGNFFDTDASVTWKMSCERYVGHFQLLGLQPSDAVSFDPVPLLIRRLRAAAHHGEGVIARQRGVDGPPNHEGCWLRFQQYDDTIKLITRDDSQISELVILFAAQSLFMEAMEQRVGVKGTIAAGEVTADFRQELHPGQPWANAQRLTESQGWFGMVLHQSAAVKTGRVIEQAPKHWKDIVQLYDIPMSNPPYVESLQALNWPMRFMKKPEELEIFVSKIAAPAFTKYGDASQNFGKEMLRRLANLQKSYW